MDLRAQSGCVALVIAVVVSSGVIGRAQRVHQAELRLRDAVHKEQVQGDLAGAIALYEEIAADAQTPRSVAAQALLNIGRCKERLGSSDARSAYERLLERFADQTAMVAEGKQRLARLQTRTSPTASAVSSTRLATFERVYGHNMSADGRFTVVMQNGQYGVGDLTTGSFTPVPNEVGLRTVEASVIAPDGRRVAYWTADARNHGQVHVSRLDGSERRVLIPPGEGEWAVPRDWSPDGRQLVVSGGQVGLAPLWVVDVATGQFRRLTQRTLGFGTIARFSPDGAYVAISDGRGSADRRSDIWVAAADGTGEERALTSGDGAMVLGWAPDGRTVLFLSNHVGVDTVSAIPVVAGQAGGAPVTLARGFPKGRPLGMSASGALVYAVDGRSIRSYIKQLDEPATDKIDVAPELSGGVLAPAWSPDGRHLSFVHGRTSGISGALIVRDLSTGTDRQIAMVDAATRGMSWSHDGQSILVARCVLCSESAAAPGNDQARSRIERVDATTGRAELIFEAGGRKPLVYPRLAPNGRDLYFVEEDQLVQVNLATRARAVLSPVEMLFDLAPDGSRAVVVVRDGDASVLRIIPTDGSPAWDLLRLGQQRRAGDGGPVYRVSGLAWTADSQSIIYGIPEGESSSLFRIGANGRSTPEPLHIPLSGHADITMSPDGRNIAYSYNVFTAELWRMDGLHGDAARARGSVGRSDGPPSATPRRR